MWRDLAIKHNLDGRKPCLFPVHFLIHVLRIFTLPSQRLLISFYNYLIMLLTDAVNESAENAIRIKKKNPKQSQGWNQADCRWNWNACQTKRASLHTSFQLYSLFFPFTCKIFFCPSDQTMTEHRRINSVHIWSIIINKPHYLREKKNPIRLKSDHYGTFT